MKRTIVTPLLFLSLMTCCAPAGAHEFIASTTGKTTIKLLTTSVVTVNGGKTIECTGASLIGGAVKTTKSLSITSTTQFEKCKAFGLAATVSLVKATSTADGSVSLLQTVTVTATGCTATFPSAKNQGLSTITYRNTNKEIEKLASIKNITSSGTGASCTYAEESSGTFKGDALVGLVSGTLEWK